MTLLIGFGRKLDSQLEEIGNEMPCHLNDDLHERFNEISIVPNWSPPNILPGANAGDLYWEAETLWIFTVVCCCVLAMDTQRK